MSEWDSLVADGYDMSMIAHNLTLTPEERFWQHDRALKLMLAFRKAGLEQIDGLSDALEALDGE